MMAINKTDPPSSIFIEMIFIRDQAREWQARNEGPLEEERGRSNQRQQAYIHLKVQARSLPSAERQEGGIRALFADEKERMNSFSRYYLDSVCKALNCDFDI